MRRGLVPTVAIGIAIAAALALAGSSCYRLPPPGSGADGDSREASGERRPADRNEGRAEATRPEPPPVSEGARIETERLQALGPTYTPFEQGPRLIWDRVAQRAVVETLAPVIEAQGLPVTTRALLWVLVGADGRVVDAVVQTHSSSTAFDRAALELAPKLLFDPARANGERVPVWVIREISLLMQ